MIFQSVDWIKYVLKYNACHEKSTFNFHMILSIKRKMNKNEHAVMRNRGWYQFWFFWGYIYVKCKVDPYKRKHNINYESF